LGGSPRELREAEEKKTLNLIGIAIKRYLLSVDKRKLVGRNNRGWRQPCGVIRQTGFLAGLKT